MHFLLTSLLLLLSIRMSFSSFSFSSNRGQAGGHPGGHPHDIKSQSGLTSLYNQKVISVQRVQRPLHSSSSAGFGSGVASLLGIKHEGVRIRTETGGDYLVHKGDGYGKSSQTVVTDAKHMFNKWTNKGTPRQVSDGHTVSDFVKTGGPDYNVLKGDHCITAAKRMNNLGKK